MSLGERLLRLRRAAGWTQRELAQRADLTTDTISRIETDRAVRPGAGTIAKIARGLVCSADDLLLPEPAHDSEPAQGAAPEKAGAAE